MQHQYFIVSLVIDKSIFDATTYQDISSSFPSLNHPTSSFTTPPLQYTFCSVNISLLSSACPEEIKKQFWLRFTRRKERQRSLRFQKDASVKVPICMETVSQINNPFSSDKKSGKYMLEFQVISRTYENVTR